MTRRHEPLSEPVTLAEWWKNRRGESIRVGLSTYEGRNLTDIRTWFPGDDGQLKPGKGFAVEIRHLPRLAAADRQSRSQGARVGPNRRRDHQ